MKSGIKILSEEQGDGPEISAKDRVTVVHSCYLHRGDVVYENRFETVTLDDRELIAGFRYGIEGMRVGGHRRFQASPHLCYSEAGVPDCVPSNALLVFEVTVNSIE
ncbi:MAG TPA: FKBP-type peptidyl-prolyl cis-trans isomerase [Planctomycetaceae bacterium]|nr:FKBP-type peptidyl-prolyl cis-trans isomerase [Planctomycetaceae bacterium]